MCSLALLSSDGADGPADRHELVRGRDALAAGSRVSASTTGHRTYVLLYVRAVGAIRSAVVVGDQRQVTRTPRIPRPRLVPNPMCVGPGHEHRDVCAAVVAV